MWPLFLIIYIFVVGSTANSAGSDQPILVEPQQGMQYWNRNLAKIAQSVFKLLITPNGEDTYSATGFLCALELQGGVHNGIHYGFITNNHAINLQLIVPKAGVRLQAIFNAAHNPETFKINMHKDTVNWFTDQFLDVTFFELTSDYVAMFVRRHYEFMPFKMPELGRHDVEHDLGRKVLVFSIPAKYDSTFTGGTILGEVSSFGKIRHSTITMDGASGSPLLDARTYKVVGIHKAAAINYRVAVSTHAVLFKMQEVGLTPPPSLNHTQGWILTVAVIEIAPRFHDAARTDDLQKLKTIIDEVRRRLSIPPGSNDMSLLKPLIDHRNADGETALMEAASAGHLDVVEFLMTKCNADVYNRGSPGSGYSAFHDAAYSGRFEIVQLMLKLRPDLLEQKDIYNNTALNVAAATGKVRIVDYLVGENANIENRGYLGRTPLFIAATGNKVKTLSYLHGKGANLSPISEEGDFPIHYAAAYGFRETVALLVELKPELLELRDVSNETALHRAAYTNDTMLLEYLIGEGADLKARNNDGRTAFLVAVAAGQLKSVEILLARGSNITATDSIGDNALHLAVRQDNVKMVKFLLENEKGPSLAKLKNSQGHDVLATAQKANSKLVINFLVQVNSTVSN